MIFYYYFPGQIDNFIGYFYCMDEFQLQYVISTLYFLECFILTLPNKNLARKLKHKDCKHIKAEYILKSSKHI